jgi:Fur family zinc uptake transcriptional regulator
LVHRLATQSAYVLLKRRPVENETLLCLVCRSCGEVDEVASTAVGKTLGSTLAAASFTPTSRLMEVEGDCSDCRRRMSLSQTS